MTLTVATTNCAGCRRRKLCRLHKIEYDVFGSVDRWLCAQCEQAHVKPSPPKVKVHLAHERPAGAGARCGAHLRLRIGRPDPVVTDDPAEVTCQSCMGLSPEVWRETQ